MPAVLMSGHHKNVENFRREQSVIRTARKRPELLEKADLTDKERDLVKSMISEE